MSEGPVNFGKPVFILVLLGCIGGGFYAYKHWPSTYEGKDGGSTWSVSWPHDWETFPAQDPATPSKVNSRGPLSEEVSGNGYAFIFFHGTITWPTMVLANIVGTPDKVINDLEIDGKKALMFEYVDNTNQYIGCAVERNDALVYVVIGCPKANFEMFRDTLTKSIKSVKCSR